MHRFNVHPVFNSHFGRGLPIFRLARIRHDITCNRNPVVAEGLFVIKPLSVIAHKDCKIFPQQVITQPEFPDRFDNLLDFLDRIVGHPYFGLAVLLVKRIAAGAIQVPRAKHLAQVNRLVLEDVIRQVQHVRYRTVIPFQANLSRFLEVFTEAFDVSDVGPAKTVNRLVVIPYDKQLLAVAEQTFHQSVLRRVDILVLVHQNFLPLFAKIFPRRLVGFEQLNRRIDQVLEHNLPRFKYRLAKRLQLCRNSLTVAVRKQIFPRHLDFQLELRKRLRKFPLREFRRHGHLLKAKELVSRALAARISARNLALKHMQRKRVERTQPHARIGEQFLHAFPHLGGGLCGEGQRQDFFRFYTAKNPVLDSLGQDRCLARAGPRQNQKLRTFLMVVQHRRTLIRI